MLTAGRPTFCWATLKATAVARFRSEVYTSLMGKGERWAASAFPSAIPRGVSGRSVHPRRRSSWPRVSEFQAVAPCLTAIRAGINDLTYSAPQDKIFA